MGIRLKLKWGIIPLTGILIGIGFLAYGKSQQEISGPKSKWEKVFFYTGKRFGIPILNASIKIQNEISEEGKPLLEIRASVNSLGYLGSLFRMNNRFLSVVEAESYAPIRYVKEIDQSGLLVKNRKYIQTITFDHQNKLVMVEQSDEKEKKKISVSSGACDPLSMFVKYYMKEVLQPDQDIPMSIYDGRKLHQMVFHARKEKVESKIWGEVEAICFESTASFSSFGDQEGIIRIWYTADGKRIPLSLELGLPVGNIHFELDEMKEG